jgi:hypothetical protein
MFGFDASRLRRGEWVVGAGGVVLLASMLLLPWYGLTRVSGGIGPNYFVSYSVDGWNGLTHGHWIMLVTIISALALVYFQGTRPAPAVPVTLSLFVTIVGLVAGLWLIYRDFISAAGSLKLGAFIGLASVCAIAVGGWESQHAEGIAARDAPAEIPTVTPGQTAAQ